MKISHWIFALVISVFTSVSFSATSGKGSTIEADWLFQADGKPTFELAKKEIGWAREIGQRISEQSAAGANLEKEMSRLGRLEKRLASKTETPELARDIYLAVRKAKRSIMFKDPLVDFSKILLIDNPYPGAGREPGHEARHRNGFMAMMGGRLLIINGLNPDSQVTTLAPATVPQASFWRPDLSWDGKKVVFSMRPDGEKSFHLYEINVDGTNFKQLTWGDYDDLDPIYSVDGKILFCTTRAHTYVRCMPYTHSFVLARCDADGKNIYVISRNSEPDYLPSILNDGRVIYTRWEYTDKALWRIQSLWSMNADGTNVTHFWGNQSVWPDVITEARAIPNSRKIMFTGVGHHHWFRGCVGIIDPADGGLNYPDGLYKVTQELKWPEVNNGPGDPKLPVKYHVSGKYGAYKTPYPLSEEVFLVSAIPGPGPKHPNADSLHFNLYLMDVCGNKEIIWKGKQNAYHAVPVRSRVKPDAFPDTVAWPKIGEDAKPPADGVLYSNNVFEGVPEINREEVKYLRIIEMDAKTYSTWWKTVQHDGPAVGLPQAESVKRVYGIVPIEEDGSVCFKLKPGVGYYFQLIDKDYRVIQNMQSFTGVMPGETRGCVGCHALRSPAAGAANVPPQRIGIAMQKGAVEPTPPPWGRESIGYERFAQPLFDKYCIKCHNGKKEKPKLNLTLRTSSVPWRWRGHHRPGEKSPFKEPYVTLIGGKIGWGRDVKKNEQGVALSLSGCFIVEGYGNQQAPAAEAIKSLGPKAAFSHRSKIVKNAMSGKHHNVKADADSLRRLIAWVDTNGPYLGEEEIHAMYDPHFETNDIGAVPARVRTAPEINRFNIRQDGDSLAVVGEPVYFKGSKPVINNFTPGNASKRLPKNMEIIKATYGAGNKTIDVTEKVKKLHADGFKKFSNYNSHFGDPTPGTPKQLSITYKANEKTRSVKFQENTPIKLK